MLLCVFRQEVVDVGIDRVSRALILALGVCYHACLEDRLAYRREVAQASRHR
jgi:hypothetical protein